MPQSIDEIRAATKLPVKKTVEFGDSPQLSRLLIQLIAEGTKRATVSLKDDFIIEQEELPMVGDLWAILDEGGQVALVCETTHVFEDLLKNTTPLFAWDEGEEDRTLEAWLTGHRSYFLRQGLVDPDQCLLVYERFRVVWPQLDSVAWLSEDIRLLEFKDWTWLGDHRSVLKGAGQSSFNKANKSLREHPGLVRVQDGSPVALLTFRPRPSGLVQVVSVNAIQPDHELAASLPGLNSALRQLAKAYHWQRIWVSSELNQAEIFSNLQSAGWVFQGAPSDLELPLSR